MAPLLIRKPHSAASGHAVYNIRLAKRLQGTGIIVSTGSGSRALVEGPMPATTISNVIRECINSRSAFIRSADSVALHARQKSFRQKLLLRKCRWRGSNHTELTQTDFKSVLRHRGYLLSCHLVAVLIIVELLLIESGRGHSADRRPKRASVPICFPSRNSRVGLASLPGHLPHGRVRGQAGPVVMISVSCAALCAAPPRQRLPVLMVARLPPRQSR